jgi:hypothetical protein
MFGFVLFAWYGLSGLMESKLKIRVSKQSHAVQGSVFVSLVCPRASNAAWR